MTSSGRPRPRPLQGDYLESPVSRPGFLAFCGVARVVADVSVLVIRLNTALANSPSTLLRRPPSSCTFSRPGEGIKGTAAFRLLPLPNAGEGRGEGDRRQAIVARPLRRTDSALREPQGTGRQLLQFVFRQHGADVLHRHRYRCWLVDLVLALKHNRHPAIEADVPNDWHDAVVIEPPFFA